MFGIFCYLSHFVNSRAFLVLQRENNITFNEFSFIFFHKKNSTPLTILTLELIEIIMKREVNSKAV